MTTPARPHVFISYAWETDDNPGHNDKVLQLAQQLGDTCEVELDVWSLQSGESTTAFMERMVNDPRITKVVVVCDRNYTEKSTAGRGGVGTETTIMTPDVYDQMQRSHRQDGAPTVKFLPVIFEYDEQGAAYRPVMFRTAKYIDLSTLERYAGNFEELERALWDRPRMARPRPSVFPAFLDTPAVDTPNVSASLRQLRAQLDQGQAVRSEQALRRHLDLVVEQWRTVRHVTVGSDTDVPAFQTELERFKPLRDEWMEVARLLARQRVLSDGTLLPMLNRFFEETLQVRQDLLEPSGENIVYSEWTVAHFDLLVFETYLLQLDAFLREQRWEAARGLVDMQVFVRREHGQSQDIPLFRFRPSGQMFNQALAGERHVYTSPAAHVMLTRSEGNRSFEGMCEAESVLYLKGVVSGGRYRAQPLTLPYWSSRTFEVFARNSRPEVAAGLAQVVGLTSWQELTEHVTAWLQANTEQVRQMEWDASVNLLELWRIQSV